MLGLYLHIPFCQAICSYCNFNRGLLDAGVKARYVDALEREILDSVESSPAPLPETARAADTIFFGGGTPSLLDPAEVGRLIGACRSTYAVTGDAEITLETNPETATAGSLEGFLRAGVNRISFGVQSFDDDELKRLGRIHSASRAKDAIRLARTAGVTNISLDLMLWLPGQSMASWLRTVDQAIDLAPDHLSLYLLELYPNAPLKDTMARAPASASPAWAQTGDDEAADMYLGGLDRLDAAGYQQYEISNVGRPDRFSRHNVKYWQSGHWRGLGCGAHSTIGGVRWKNVSATSDYIERVATGQSVATEVRRLSTDERVADALITGLRLSEGIDLGTFLERYGVDPWQKYVQALAPCVDDGLVWRTPARFGLTRRGMLVANEILLTFV
jgi:oxygen-independent coproporphyrinogen III oxidase